MSSKTTQKRKKKKKKKKTEGKGKEDVEEEKEEEFVPVFDPVTMTILSLDNVTSGIDG